MTAGQIAKESYFVVMYVVLPVIWVRVLRASRVVLFNVAIPDAQNLVATP